MEDKKQSYPKWLPWAILIGLTAFGGLLKVACAAPITVQVKNDSMVYIRTIWDATNDFVQSVKIPPIVKGAATHVNFQTMGLIPHSTADGSTYSTALSPSYKDATDDACPINLGSTSDTYIGANHGMNYVKEVTSTGHGLTDAWVGSGWRDAAPKTFYLIKIVDANKLWFLAGNTGTDSVWQFGTTFTGATLTEINSSTPITINSSTTTQLKPSSWTINHALYVDGVAITADGVYYGNTVKVVDNYRIKHPPAVLDYVIAGNPWSGSPDFTDTTIADLCERYIDYNFAENGSCTVHERIDFKKGFFLGYMGWVQAGAPTVPSSGTLNLYVPKMDTFIISSTTYDLSNIQNITGTISTLDLTKGSGRWLSDTEPPDRFVEFTKTSGGAKYFGIGLGYPITKLMTTTPNRLLLVDQVATILTSSKKMYPYVMGYGGVTGGTYASGRIARNTSFETYAYRCPINYSINPEPTSIYWYYIGSECYLQVDYNSAQTDTVALPQVLWGKKFTVVEKSSGMTVMDTRIEPRGLILTAATGNQYVTLKINTGSSANDGWNRSQWNRGAWNSKAWNGR